MINLKKLFKQVLKEANYNWDIEPTDRSWIISKEGEIKGGINHRAILKKFFTKEWNELKYSNKSDTEIEMILEVDLLNKRMIYVGELTDLYVITLKLDRQEKDLIQGFVKSFLIKHNNFKNRDISIQIYNGKTEKYKIHQIVDDYLYSID